MCFSSDKDCDDHATAPPSPAGGGGGNTTLNGSRLHETPQTSHCHVLSTQGHGCSGSMVVMDGDTTKLNVPLHAVVLPMQSSSTTALGAPRQPPHMQRSSTPTLCRLYLQGRCRQQERCHQVHADRSVIELLREQIRRRPPCCCIHTPDLVLGVDGVMPWGLPPAVHLVVDASTTISLLSTAPTVGLLELYRLHGSLALECSSSQFCRNHQPIPSDGASSSSLMCRFGDTCRYLHVCRTSRERLMEDSRRRSDELMRAGARSTGSGAPSSLAASHCLPAIRLPTPPPASGGVAVPRSGSSIMECSFRSEEDGSSAEFSRSQQQLQLLMSSASLHSATTTTTGSSTTTTPTAHYPYPSKKQQAAAPSSGVL